jgi:hypothetical protein
MGLESHFDAVRFAAAGAQLDVCVNETGETLNPVQNGLNFELDSWAPGRGFAVFVDCNLLDRVWPGYSISSIRHANAP